MTIGNIQHIVQTYRRQAFDSYDHPGKPDTLPPLTQPYLAQLVRAVFDELDVQQLAFTRQLTPPQRLRQVFELNGALRKLVIASIHRQFPGIDPAELNRRVAQRISGIHEL